MRNLKRLLTMVMAIAMLMSLMVVGAGATSFKDDKDITHKDAVEKMASLSIINGRDGNFDPTGIVTRAEMCKMVCVALNGGNDPKLNPGTVVTASFTDTKDHWASGYIEYCVNMNIVAGLGDKTFGPDQKVTASQASKMLLVALGYDAAFEKFTGATWALNSNKIAMQKGLYDEIQGIDPNAPMTRDAAAQMIYNFCYANMVKYEFGISGGTGGAVTGVKQAVDVKVMVNGTERYETVLTKYYKLVSFKGTMTQITYDTKKKEYGYVISYETVAKDGTKGTASETFYTTANHANKMGLKVELLFKDKNNDGYNRADDTVYDINLDDSAIIVTGDMTDFDKYDQLKDTLKFDGTTYDLDKKVINGMFAFNGTANKLELKPNAKGDGYIFDNTATVNAAVDLPYTITLLDNDNNGKIDTFVVVPFTVQKVTYVASDSITFSGQGILKAGVAMPGMNNVEKKDLTAYEGIAKDDIVAYYTSGNTAERTATAVKMDLKTGVASEIRSDKKQAKIEGTWYDLMTSTSVKAGDTLKFAAVGSNIYYAKITEAEATSRNVLAVYNTVDVDSRYGNFSNSVKAKVIFGIDGTKKEVIVSKLDGVELGDAASFMNAADVTIGKMFSYKVDSDGEYELTTLTKKDAPNENLAGHDNYVEASKYSDKKIGGYELADNATVLVVSSKDNDAKKYSGAEIKRNYGDNQDFGSKAYALVDETNSFNYATVATIVTTDDMPKMTSGLKYGYLLANPSTSREAGKDFRNFSVWTTEGKKSLKEDETDSFATAMVKGGFITYNVVDAADKEVVLVKDVAVADIRVGYVSGWDDAKKDRIQFNDREQYDVDKDTQIFNINVKDVAGVEGNAIVVGNTTTKTNNAYYIVNPDKTKVDLVVVDLSGIVADKGTKTLYGATASDVNAALATADVLGVRVAGDFTTASAITVPAGKTLTFEGANVTTAGIELKANAQLNFNGNLTMNGTNTLDNTAKISGAGTLKIGALANNYDFSNLTVNNIVITQNYAPANKLTVLKSQTLTMKGDFAPVEDVTVAGNLVVEKATTVAADKKLIVDGTAVLGGVLNTVDNNKVIGTGTVTVDGTILGNGTVNVKSMPAATANVTVKNLNVTSDFTVAKAYTVSADQNVTFKGALKAENGVIVSKDAVVTVDGLTTVKDGQNLKINGTATLNGLTIGTGTVDGTGTVTFKTLSNTGAGAILAQVTTTNLVIDVATFAPSDAWTMDTAAQTVTVTGDLTPVAAVNVTDGNLVVEGTYTTAAAGTVGGTLTIKKGATIAATHDITGTGVVKVAQGATVNASADIVKVENAGTINVKAAVVIDTLSANTGTIKVEANSLTITKAAAIADLNKISGNDTTTLILTLAAVEGTPAGTVAANLWYSADKTAITKLADITNKTYTWTKDCDTGVAGDQAGWMRG